MSATTVSLDWTPHEGQRKVMESDARFRIVACGRRYGKTELAAHEVFESLGIPGAKIWWVAPTYDISDIGFDLVREIIPDPLIDGTPKFTKPKGIDVVSGASVSFRSADREDSLRGEGIDLLVFDEAGMIPERAWTEELRPTLSDTLGRMIAISTPKGRNWFYEWWQRGQSDDHPDVVSWSGSTYENPHVPDSEIDQAKAELPERVFSQEYLGEFLDDSGGVFERVEERIVESYDYAAAIGEPPYVTSVDFARHQDWTVITVLDSTGRLVDFDRMRHVSWPEIQSSVETMATKYDGHVDGAYDGIVKLDATRDNKIVSDLELKGFNVEPVKFTSQSKKRMVEGLAALIEQEAIVIPEIDQLIHELQVFEYSVTPAGNVRYHAPEGFTDDCIDSLMMACESLEDLRRHRLRREAATDVDEERSGGVSFV